MRAPMSVSLRRLGSIRIQKNGFLRACRADFAKLIAPKSFLFAGAAGAYIAGRSQVSMLTCSRPLNFSSKFCAECASRAALESPCLAIRHKGPELEPRAFVGMIRLERTTPTSRTWCANQLRYIPIEKINLPLSKFIDIDC